MGCLEMAHRSQRDVKQQIKNNNNLRGKGGGGVERGVLCVCLWGGGGGSLFMVHALSQLCFIVMATIKEIQHHVSSYSYFMGQTSDRLPGLSSVHFRHFPVDVST